MESDNVQRGDQLWSEHVVNWNISRANLTIMSGYVSNASNVPQAWVQTLHLHNSKAACLGQAFIIKGQY